MGPVNRVQFNSALQKIFDALEVYFFPSLLIGVTLWVLVQSMSADERPVIEPIEIKVWVQDAENPSPSLHEVQASLQGLEPVTSYETRLSTLPVWFALQTEKSKPGVGHLLDFPSRHSISMACWDSKTQKSLGSATRSGLAGDFIHSRGGFALNLQAEQTLNQVICTAAFRGPARLSVALWQSQDLIDAQRSHRDLGVMIEAGLGVLILFMLLTALINRSWLYLTFCGWLLLNMRMASLSAGADWSFLGFALKASWVIDVRQWTLCLYSAMTVFLFTRLFNRELQKISRVWLLDVLKIVSVFLLVSAFFLSYENTLRLIWPCTLAGATLIVWFLYRILDQYPSRMAGWYAASISISLLASLNEVLAAATGQRFLISGLNSGTAAIASALLVSSAVAEHMRNERKEKIKALNTLEAAYMGSPIGLFTVDTGGYILKTNPAFQFMTRMGLMLHPLHLSQLFEPGVVEEFSQLQLGSQSKEIVLQTRLLDSSAQQDSWFSILASKGEDVLVEGTLQDITERVQSTQRLEFMVNHDPLTECLNLRGMSRIYERSKSQPVALAYFDLDRFKIINDLYGHSLGDEVLRQVCDRIQKHLGPNDLLARLGGDEFLVAFSETSLEQASQISWAIVNDISSGAYQVERHYYSLSVSGGLVRTQRFKDLPFREVISAADTLCRIAKKSLGERLVVMNSGDQFFKFHKEELELIAALQQDETPAGLYLVMQPEISLTAPFDTLNFEVLLRLRKGDGQILPAGLIIEAAEAQGKTTIIDRWVLTTIIEWLESHRDELKNTRFVGVNLSGGSLNNEAFTEELFTLFEKHPLAMSMICIEITETVALKDMRGMQRFIDRLRSIGIRVSLDDFGAGYSSFGYLKGLTVDALKLDGSLVRDAAQSLSGMAIIEAIAGLVTNLGMKSIGEFAEDLKTLRVLSTAGVDYAQGYGISKPVLPEKILAAQSCADLIEDPEILAFFRQLQANEVSTLPLFESGLSSNQTR